MIICFKREDNDRMIKMRDFAPLCLLVELVRIIPNVLREITRIVELMILNRRK
ncbi:hypothetical protein WKT02_10395 [Erysipelotrichaceae bacterium HCN-30851]